MKEDLPSIRGTKPMGCLGKLAGLHATLQEHFLGVRLESRVAHVGNFLGLCTLGSEFHVRILGSGVLRSGFWAVLWVGSRIWDLGFSMSKLFLTTRNLFA